MTVLQTDYCTQTIPCLLGQQTTEEAEQQLHIPAVTSGVGTRTSITRGRV